MISGWILVVCGLVQILSVNFRGGYHKDRMPNIFPRIALTICGIAIICEGLSMLNWLRFA